MNRRIVIGTRGSRLARVQTDYIAERIRAIAPGIEISIEVISTKGDRILDVPLAEIGGKGLFTLELETALRDGGIDLAVHSLKDLPTEDPEGLVIAAVPERATPNDALVSPSRTLLRDLPAGTRIGTSSLRRKAQLLAFNPGFAVVNIRGNVETRMKRAGDGTCDAVILACAGLERLGLGDAVVEVISPGIMLPACGQGALAVQTRVNDAPLRDLLATLHHADTAASAGAERAMLAALGGGCQVPIGALAEIDADALSLRGCVCSPDGTRIVRVELDGLVEDAEALGREAAERLLAAGAAALIAEIA